MGAQMGSCWSQTTSVPHDDSDQPLRTRSLLFSQSHVVFACDLDLDNFLESCTTQALCIEVHGALNFPGADYGTKCNQF